MSLSAPIWVSDSILRMLIKSDMKLTVVGLKQELEELPHAAKRANGALRISLNDIMMIFVHI